MKTQLAIEDGRSQTGMSPPKVGTMVGAGTPAFFQSQYHIPKP